VTDNHHNDSRLQALEAWLSDLYGRDMAATPASSDASFRRYFRFSLGDKTVVAMDAPPPQEDCRPFVGICQRLAGAGVHVPAILAQDIERGFLLLEDLGSETLLEVLNEQNADALYQDAINTLVTMQQHTAAENLPVYDAALLRRELELFPQWYLQQHLGAEIDAPLREALDALFDRLIAEVLKQPQVFVHRDYMPRNLMLAQPNPAVIDFQDAVLGPITYDPICLFKDAFISWPPARVEAWLLQYWQQARAAQLPVADNFEQFYGDCEIMGVQRHIKVIGIFARIFHRDGKPHYLGDVPRFFNYLTQVVERRPDWPELADVLQRVNALAEAQP
jgi:hypothetical protein